MSNDSARDPYGRTELHYAALHGQEDAVNRLVEEGAGVNAQDREGFTPLHFAAQESQLNVAKALLAAGASTAAQNVHGNTALSTATFSSDGRGELISLLLAYGADPDSQNKYGVSPRTLAAMIANFNVAQFFEDRG